jgi:pteridine reductase
MAKIAVVTGGGKKRLGYHIACEAARRGYSVVVHFNSSSLETELTVKELQSLGAPAARSYQADFSVPAETEKFAQETLQDFGRVDLLINTASIWPKRTLQETDYNELKRNFDVNLGSVFLLSKVFGLQMTGQPDGGVIVNYGDWAIRRPYLNYSAYYASKGAIPTITAMFAKELGALNPKVRVNCVEPGPVMVPDGISESEKAEIVNATVVKRLGTPDDLVAATFALIDNSFITGTCLSVDGGRTIA